MGGGASTHLDHVAPPTAAVVDVDVTCEGRVDTRRYPSGVRGKEGREGGAGEASKAGARKDEDGGDSKGCDGEKTESSAHGKVVAAVQPAEKPGCKH